MNIKDILNNELTSATSEIREAAYIKLCGAISENQINEQDKLMIFNHCTTTIFNNLGSEQENYTRSFNLLIIACLLENNLQEGFLNDAQVTKLFNMMVEYLKHENTNFGYSKQVGWIHTLAHAADVFLQLFKYDIICNDENLETYITLTFNKYVNHKYIYVDDEAARIFCALVPVDKTSISQIYFKLFSEFKTKSSVSLEDYITMQNFYNFVQTFRYFTFDVTLIALIENILMVKYEMFINYAKS